MARTLWVVVALSTWIGAGWLAPRGALRADAAAKERTQSVLGPGLYVFQTRTRGSTCGDSERDGFVMSFVAAVDGIPGSVTMSMELVNTPHFKNWSLHVTEKDVVQGSSRMGTTPQSPDAQFSVSQQDGRWTGTGSRTYQGKLDGKTTRCRVDFDTLLRRIDI